MNRLVFLLFAIALAPAAQADGAAAQVKLRPGRLIQIVCNQGSERLKVQGSSDQLRIYRVGESRVHYEIFTDDFITASCDSIRVE